MRYIATGRDVMEGIKERAVFEQPRYSLAAIMKRYGMEMYLDICENRVLDEVGLDGEDITFNFIRTPDIIMTESGIKRVKRILQAFLSDKQVENLMDYVRAEEEATVAKNNAMWVLRSRTRKQLKDMLAEVENIRQSSEDIRKMKEEIICEIKSRNSVNLLQVYLSEAITGFWIQIKYFDKFRMLKNAVSKFRMEEGAAENLTAEDMPEIIRRNYERYRKIPVRKRSIDDTRKYIYWGIRFYADFRKGRKTKSCFHIEEDYKAMTDIVQAVSRITPESFLSLFQPEREYDGEKYQQKDYFSSMEAVKRFQAGKPIGERVMCFLEEFYSRPVFFFWCNYFGCLTDYEFYCGIKEPCEKYFRQIREFHGLGESLNGF